MALFMGGKIVHDDVQDFARCSTSHDLVHEGQEILARLRFVRSVNHLAGRHFKGCKECGGAVSVRALHRLPDLMWIQLGARVGFNTTHVVVTVAHTNLVIYTKKDRDESLETHQAAFSGRSAWLSATAYWPCCGR